LSGGRRVISLVALAAAMQYLTPADRLWHIHTPAELAGKAGDEAILHAPLGAGVRLVPVPFVPWVACFPGLATLLKRSPQEIGESELGWLDPQERERCQRVWDMLTPREKEALRELAQGSSRKEAARQIKAAQSTADEYIKSIRAKCRLVLETQDGEEFKNKFPAAAFGPFLSGLKQA
jgi:DNA-binding CsgD family transcriptional regulator